MHRSMGFPARIMHLPNFAPPVELASPIPAEPGDDKLSPPFFLFVGRLEKLKGVQTLIRVFLQYRKAELWIAGRGSYEAQLRRLAGRAQNIRFLGRLGQRELQALYRRAVAVIVPSIVFEIFGLVIIEAFQQHTPVLARRIGGMPEILEESGAGFLYDNNEELIAAMDQLLANPSYRDELGELGYRSYQREWTAEVHLKRYLALIEQIAAGREQLLKQQPTGTLDEPWSAWSRGGCRNRAIANDRAAP
jgi:glycosyltransferase involved in cell wall biosynthesis